MQNKIPFTFILLSACQVDYELTGERPDVNPGDVLDCPFSPVSGTKMQSYDCNPVFQNTDENWGGDVGSVGFYATEVLGHPFYQMWYTSSGGNSFGQFGMGYATSADGSSWQTHPQNPLFEAETSAWDSDSVAGQVIVWDPIDEQYVMAYQGFTLGTGEFDPNTFEIDNGTWGLGVATSSDGVTWNKSPRNPVIDFNAYDPFTASISPCWPLTITLSRRGFKGYIAATKTDESFFGEAPCHIYGMSGLDAETWVIDEARPILEAGEAYDRMGIAGASVVEYNEILYMFYVGFQAWEQYDGYQSATNLTLNLATSRDDGVSWQKDPNNPIPIGRSQEGLISDVAAQVIGERIHVWVTDDYDGQQAVGYFLYEPSIEIHP